MLPPGAAVCKIMCFECCGSFQSHFFKSIKLRSRSDWCHFQKTSKTEQPTEGNWKAHLHSWNIDPRRLSLTLSQVIFNVLRTHGFSMGSPRTGYVHSLVHHRFPLGPACRSYDFIIVIFLISGPFSFSCHDSEECTDPRRAASVGLSALKTINALKWVWSCG